MKVPSHTVPVTVAVFGGVLLNDGSGQFDDPELFEVGERPEDVAIVDLNGDSVVDGQDLAVVLGAWGLPCGE